MKRRNFLAGLLAIPAIVSKKEEVNTVKKESVKYLRGDGEHMPLIETESPLIGFDTQKNKLFFKTKDGIKYFDDGGLLLGNSPRNISDETAETLANSMGKTRQTMV